MPCRRLQPAWSHHHDQSSLRPTQELVTRSTKATNLDRCQILKNHIAWTPRMPPVLRAFIRGTRRQQVLHRCMLKRWVMDRRMLHDCWSSEALRLYVLHILTPRRRIRQHAVRYTRTNWREAGAESSTGWWQNKNIILGWIRWRYDICRRR